MGRSGASRGRRPRSRAPRAHEPRVSRRPQLPSRRGASLDIGAAPG